MATLERFGWGSSWKQRKSKKEEEFLHFSVYIVILLISRVAVKMEKKVEKGKSLLENEFEILGFLNDQSTTF